MNTQQTTCAVLLDCLDGAFGPRGWQGPTLHGSLRGVTVKAALFKPRPRRRCIWEIVLHAAYWKYAVRRHVEDAAAVAHVARPGASASTASQKFDRSPANWPAVPTCSGKAAATAWAKDRALLKREHELLRAAVERVDPGAWFSIPPRGRNWTLARYTVGIAAHDAYHCGQIQLLKRLAHEGR